MTERFSASNAARFMACPASANLDVAIPGWTPPVVDKTKGAKGRGTEIHDILAQAGALSRAELSGLVKALQFLEDLRTKRRFKVLIEETFVAEWLVSKPKTTLDLALYVTDELHIIDWKTGKIPVDVAGNQQLLFYAACTIDLAPRARGVWLHIVQPWAANTMSVFVTVAELRKFIKLAKEAELKVLNMDTTFGPSDHCQFCPAYPHSRSDKGRPLCATTLNLLYPKVHDDQAILDL